MKYLIVCFLLAISFSSSSQNFTVDLDNCFFVMKNPFLKVPIEEIVERKGKGKLSFDVKKMTVKINFKSTEFATIDSSEYTLTNDISKLDSDDMSIFIFESISTGKDATKGKMKLELLNTKYTGDSKTVFVFESEYLVILYRGKRAEVTFD